MSDYSRMLWRCRRGIQELDIFFKDFIEQHYDQLSPEEMHALENLLDQADPDILSWIMGASEPPTNEFIRIIGLIRDTTSKTD
jgi:antitoxin CptB